MWLLHLILGEDGEEGKPGPKKKSPSLQLLAAKQLITVPTLLLYCRYYGDRETRYPGGEVTTATQPPQDGDMQNHPFNVEPSINQSRPWLKWMDAY